MENIKIKDKYGQYHKISRSEYAMRMMISNSIVLGLGAYAGTKLNPVSGLFGPNYSKRVAGSWAIGAAVGSLVGAAFVPESGPILQEYLPKWMLPGDFSMKVFYGID